MMSAFIHIFGRRSSLDKLRRVEEMELEIARSQTKTLAAIDNGRQTAHNLKKVLERNHISIQISKAIGNKNNANHFGNHS